MAEPRIDFLGYDDDSFRTLNTMPLEGQTPEELVAQAVTDPTIVAIARYYQISGFGRLRGRDIAIPAFRHHISTIYPDGQSFSISAARQEYPGPDSAAVLDLRKQGASKVVLMRNQVWQPFGTSDLTIPTQSAHTTAA